MFPKPKPTNRQARNAKREAAFRDDVWERDGIRNGAEQYGNCFRCHVLIVRGDSGTVDHKKPRSTHPERKYDPTNGRLACYSCQDYLKRHPLERE